jgi:hypothetical protein
MSLSQDDEDKSLRRSLLKIDKSQIPSVGSGYKFPVTLDDMSNYISNMTVTDSPIEQDLIRTFNSLDKSTQQRRDFISTLDEKGAKMLLNSLTLVEFGSGRTLFCDNKSCAHKQEHSQVMTPYANVANASDRVRSILRRICTVSRERNLTICEIYDVLDRFIKRYYGLVNIDIDVDSLFE